MADELFDPYAALGIPQDASQDLIEVAFEMMQKRFQSVERGKRTAVMNDQYRDAKRAHEILTLSLIHI